MESLRYATLFSGTILLYSLFWFDKEISQLAGNVFKCSAVSGLIFPVCWCLIHINEKHSHLKCYLWKHVSHGKHSLILGYTMSFGESICLSVIAYLYDIVPRLQNLEVCVPIFFEQKFSAKFEFLYWIPRGPLWLNG